MIQFTEKQTQKFWNRVNKVKNTECWNWKGALFWCGYGQFGPLYAHRVAYALTYGPIPVELQCLHKCDNRKCCNPNHLWLGTNADNMADKMRKGRQSHGAKHSAAVIAKTPRGIRHPHHKLTENQVREIRKLYANTEQGYKPIARTFGVRWQSIQAIIKGHTWTHI